MKAGMKPPEQSGESPLDKAPARTRPSARTRPRRPSPTPSGAEARVAEAQGRSPTTAAPIPSGENRPSPPRVDEPGQPLRAEARTPSAGATSRSASRQVFQNQIRDDLPIQYRDWIDSYHRRLNKGR